jgi:hypothetical protein
VGAEEFEAEYQLDDMEGVSGLHLVLRPHLLRRIIKEVRPGGWQEQSGPLPAGAIGRVPLLAATIPALFG